MEGKASNKFIVSIQRMAWFRTTASKVIAELVQNVKQLLSFDNVVGLFPQNTEQQRTRNKLTMYSSITYFSLKSAYLLSSIFLLRMVKNEARILNKTAISESSIT